MRLGEKNHLWVCFSLLGLTMWIAGCAEGETPSSAPPVDAAKDIAPPTDEAGSTTGGGAEVPMNDEEEMTEEETIEEAVEETSEEPTDEATEEESTEEEATSEEAAEESPG